MTADELKEFCKNVDIKQIEGINFNCKECGASFSVPFATQQLYSYTCPNCGAIWCEQSGYVKHIRELKSAIEFFSISKNADINLTLRRENK